MNQEEIIIQISTGGYLEHKVTAGEVCERLDALCSTMKIEKAIIGWSGDRALYQEVLGYLKEKEVEAYLWLPVFSETGVIKNNLGRLLDYREAEVTSYGLSQGENFEFYCPNQKRNSQGFLELYRENFEGLAFDGVFLDKIRYGACSNGLGGIFNCFCGDCMKFYESRGLDIQALRREMELVSLGTGEYGDKVLGAVSYKNGRYCFEKPIWEEFFAAKAAVVTRALEPVTSYFRDKGMKIGMDTFAPYLAYFSGQDMGKLAAMADFLKPMMYRITNAPAGLPFETECLIRETARGNREKAREQYFHALGCGNGNTPWTDMDFINRELEYASGWGTPVYCGFEVNRNGAAASTPEYIEETINGLRCAPVNGYVLSWDVMSATEENMRAAAACIGRGRQ